MALNTLSNRKNSIQELEDIDFQTNTEYFQVHGNECAAEASYLWEIAFASKNKEDFQCIVET